MSDSDDRVHPLPYSLQTGWVTLEAQSRGDDDRPYALRLGRHDGVIASLSEGELRQLRDRIDLVLAAPFRVVVVGGDGRGYDDPELNAAVRDHLDRLHGRYPHMEIATESEPAPAGHAAEQWAVTAGVPSVLFRDLDSAMAAGGNRVVLIAGPDGPHLAGLAHQASIGLDLIRLGACP